MNIDVIGRHALLFDDDATAAFVNSKDALVEWNSLLIDRYDARHLLSGPPPSRRRRNLRSSSSPPSASSIESELDYERFLDLPPPGEEHESDAEQQAAGGFNAVPFSYGTEASSDQNNTEPGLEGGFHPPFPLPDSLIQNLPPTEKVHQIIARTALFVAKNGGQSEIVLRVKQGGNPTFGFLMPDHHLHAYFRFLVDRQELLQPKEDGKSENEEKASKIEQATASGALSLLGSMYGTGEEEDGTTESLLALQENVSDVKTTISLASERAQSFTSTVGKDEAVSKIKEEEAPTRKTSSASALKGGAGAKRKGESSASGKLRASSLPPISKVEPLFVEPPSDVKRLVDKIVEFIMKNGKQFEAVLVEQDREHGRFPFLMESNQYHPYYMKVLQKAQEAKLTVKSFSNEKEVSIGHAADKKISSSKEHETLLSESGGYDIPYDSDRKEKFKMVIGKGKKDGVDLPSKPTQPQLGVRVDAAQVAAILQAATRGIKNPNLGILSNTRQDGNSHGPNSEGTQPSNLGNLQSSQPESVSKPVAEAAAKSAGSEVANESEFSDVHLTQEQKLKAERLKRAKMYVAMLKSAPAPSKTEPFRGLSAEPQASRASGFGAEVSIVEKEREVSSLPLDGGTSDRNEKLKRDHFNDERRSRRKYRPRSNRHEEDESKEDNDNDDDDGDDDDDDRGEEKRSHIHKHSRKRHRHRHSSSGDDDDTEYDKNKDESKGHKSHRSSRKNFDGEEKDEESYRYSRKKHRSHLSYEDDDDDENVDNRGEEAKEEREHKIDRKRSSKRHRSYHSSHKDGEQDDEDETDYTYSRKNHSSHEEDDDKRDRRHSRRKHRSHRSSHHSRDRHKRRKSDSSYKDRKSRPRDRYDVSSDEEPNHHSKHDKHMKESHSESEELEEGEISSKISNESRGHVRAAGASREASVDISSSYKDQKAPSQPTGITEAPDDLRAKVRAMLMSTL